MAEGKRLTVIFEAALCSLGLMVFSFFIQYKFPVKLFSFAALLMSAFIISRNFRSIADLKMIIGENISFNITLLLTIIGIVLGIALAVRYRKSLDISSFPAVIHLFVIPAALIGCMEELVFRGFIQGYVKSINGPFSILFGTLSHTGYKCCLFLAPVVTADIDIGYLAFYTFIVGIISGTIKQLSKSLVPSLSAHALFDILVYAECVTAPWWIW
jgi:membrane protease YdiL (CAAX protease family)